ncbi:uncharacterized protein RAG0_01547 [Rhynchosporium agropyri]|uniref:2EXR domain-containing protein n=1 Tax=Rhynchosporium agropyri TaxID=914238 RepID=A0A1E1K1Q9_9HELO|nr:uncharacterized protein RAG0_01547 [Rhynchosporium agropyri]
MASSQNLIYPLYEKDAYTKGPREGEDFSNLAGQVEGGEVSPDGNDTDEWDKDYCDLSELEFEGFFGLNSSVSATTPMSDTSSTSLSATSSSSPTPNSSFSTPENSSEHTSHIPESKSTTLTRYQSPEKHPHLPNSDTTTSAPAPAPAPTPQEVFPKLNVRDAPPDPATGHTLVEFPYFPFLPPDLRSKILRLACPPPSNLRIRYSIPGLRKDHDRSRDGDREEDGEWRFEDGDAAKVGENRMVRSLAQGWREARFLMMSDGWGVVHLKAREECRWFTFKKGIMVWEIDMGSERGRERADMRVAIPCDIPISKDTTARVECLGVSQELWLKWPFAPLTSASKDPDSYQRHATDPWKAQLITLMSNLQIFKLLIPKHASIYRQKRLVKIVSATFKEVLADADEAGAGAVPRPRPRVEVVAMKNV